MDKLPNDIYLQVCGYDWNGRDIQDDSDTSWCTERTNDDDEVYVRKTSVAAKLAAAELMAEALEEEYRFCSTAADEEMTQVDMAKYWRRIDVQKTQALAAWKAARDTEGILTAEELALLPPVVQHKYWRAVTSGDESVLYLCYLLAQALLEIRRLRDESQS